MSNKTKDEKMDVKEAFETLFGARKVKKAYERLNEDFSWNVNLHIYKYRDGYYSVEDSDQLVQYGDIEKIE